MTKPELMTNGKCRSVVLRHSSFVILSSFACRAVAWRRRLIRASSLLLIALSIFPGRVRAADNLGVLGSKPKWDVLENYQNTITHDEFAHLINDVYCTH